MKRFLSILLLLCIIFSLSVFALADGDADAADIEDPTVTGQAALAPFVQSTPEPTTEPASQPVITDPLTPILNDGAEPGTTTYTVTFETYGHCAAPASQTVAAGGHVTKPADPAGEELMFSRWCTFEDGSRREWDFDNDTVTKDTTLVACFYWGVYFNTSELCDSPEPQLVETGDLVVRPDNPTGDGLTFVTWYVFDSEGNKSIWNFETDVVTGPVTMEASFLIRELTGISITDRAVITLPALSLGHYYLARFRSEAGAADTLANMILPVESIATATEEEKLDHAMYTWTVNNTNSFRVESGDTIYCAVGKVLNIFDCIGVEGTDKDYVSQVCTLVCPFCYIVTLEDGVNDTYGYYYFLGDVPALVVPEREGYYFEGWYYDAAFTQAYSGEAVTKSFTLYGKWTPIETERDSRISLQTGSMLPYAILAVAMGAAAVAVCTKKREDF